MDKPSPYKPRSQKFFFFFQNLHSSSKACEFLIPSRKSLFFCAIIGIQEINY